MNTDPTTIHLSGDAAAAIVARRAFVAMIRPSAGRVVDLPAAVDIAVGRSRSSEIQIDESAVSRLHATLRWDGGDAVIVTDHGSRNGTLVDGRRVTGKVEARSGAEIVIGNAAMVIVIAGDREERKAESDRDTPAILTADAAMQPVLGLVDLAAKSDSTILLLGETGVGKELLARHLHGQSRRASGAFVAVNCAAIPESLAESAFFGHERGAFSGAVTRQTGYFEAAHRGTLFLDEVGELSLASQARLLRVLEQHEMLRVGSVKPVSVDVRIVAATHRDLEREVEQGMFRRDLFYRLNVLPIHIPPLRDRPLDIEALARHFAGELAKRDDIVLTDGALALLRAHPWPGNVRELRNTMERLVAMHDLSQPIGEQRVRDALPSKSARLPVVDGALQNRIDEVERQAVVEALEACGGNQSRAAERLGISRRAFIYRLEKYGLKDPPASRGGSGPRNG